MSGRCVYKHFPLQNVAQFAVLVAHSRYRSLPVPLTPGTAHTATPLKHRVILSYTVGNISLSLDKQGDSKVHIAVI